MPAPHAAVHAPIQTGYETIFLEHRGQVLATLIGQLRDFDLAEEALQDALVSALEHWPVDGVPARPGAWLTTVSRRKAIDRLRKRRRTEDYEPGQFERRPRGVAAIDNTPDVSDDIPDERLKLMFTCCHPALPGDQQVALTLHTLGGLTTVEIAAAFMVPLATMAQRLVRAKKQIKDAHIPYQVPGGLEIAHRIDAVATVLYLIFTEGYGASAGVMLMRHDLCDEAIRLARVLRELITREAAAVPRVKRAEIIGLLALMLLHHSRRAARLDAAGELVLLADQDRAAWDQGEIAEGLQLVDEALALGRPGAYQIQAAISAVHAGAREAADTDWPQIAGLYDALLVHLDTPMVRVNAAVAVSMAHGPEAGLRLLDDGAGGELYVHHLARADMLRRAGRVDESRAAYDEAIRLCANATEVASMRRQRGLLA